MIEEMQKEQLRINSRRSKNTLNKSTSDLSMSQRSYSDAESENTLYQSKRPSGKSEESIQLERQALKKLEMQQKCIPMP